MLAAIIVLFLGVAAAVSLCFCLWVACRTCHVREFALEFCRGLRYVLVGLLITANLFGCLGMGTYLFSKGYVTWYECHYDDVLLASRCQAYVAEQQQQCTADIS